MFKKFAKGLLTISFIVGIILALGFNETATAVQQMCWTIGWFSLAALSAYGLDKLGTFNA